MRALGLVVMLGASLGVACDGGEPAAPESAMPPSSGGDEIPETPTWHRDVAPILAAHCMGCHEGGLTGPFALTGYDDVRPRHLAIVNATSERRMPPWLPAEGCQSFRGARRIRDRDIEVLRRWSKTGAQAGEPAPSAPAIRRIDRTLAWIDRTLDTGASYVPRPEAGALDDRRCFLLDPAIAEDTFLVGYDLVPTRRAQVLRAVLVETPLDEARAKDAADPGPGWACSNDVGVGTGRVLARWASAFGAVALPEGAGVRLRKGYGIALQLGYHIHGSGHGAPTGAADQTQVTLQLARSAVTREAEFVALPAALSSVPARTFGYSVSSSVTMPSAGTIWAVEPRMHLLGKRFRVELDPEGAKTCLLDVPRWDYHWEEMHFLDAQGIPVAAGSRISVSCVWDNPTDQPRQSGPDLDDETCEVALIVTRP